jgi:hypothetical protein
MAAVRKESDGRLWHSTAVPAVTKMLAVEGRPAVPSRCCDVSAAWPIREDGRKGGTRIGDHATPCSQRMLTGREGARLTPLSVCCICHMPAFRRVYPRAPLSGRALIPLTLNHAMLASES